MVGHNICYNDRSKYLFSANDEKLSQNYQVNIPLSGSMLPFYVYREINELLKRSTR